MEKVFTNVEYAAWLREQARMKRPYWYGVYHLPCTEELLAKKARQYPEHYAQKRMPRYRQDIAAGQIAGDCVNGAIKGAVWGELGRRTPVYASHGCPDTNADGLFEKCRAWGMEWGPISTIPNEPGIAVHMSGHVGVTVGDGEVVEWRGFAHGCVETKLKARRWLNWFRLPWVEYLAGGGAAQENAAQAGTLGARLLRRGMKGEDVRILQELLMALGGSLPVYGADGEFGGETEEALKAFQRRQQLNADGIYGGKTHAALTAVVTEAEDGEEDEESESAQPVKYVAVTGGCVRLREGAGQEYGTVGFVNRGARLEWVATAANGWHAVKADGLSGWIGPRYTQIEEAAV